MEIKQLAIRRFGLTAACVWLAVAPTPGVAQATSPRAADVASPEALTLATYEAVNRTTGEPHDWARFRSLFLSTAQLIPNVQQTGGQLRVHSVEDFVAWIEASGQVGSASDRGFVEEEIALTVHRFGNVAQAFSTYEKRFADDTTILGRGINSFLLVHGEGGWRIAAIAWDEERRGLSIPPAYGAAETRARANR